MGKRKRGRCVKKNTNVNTEPEEAVQAPHSFVIHRGLPGGYITDLTKDFRKVMEPYTAMSLREKKKNSIKDFVSIAGPLHVSHMTIFSRTELGMYMKIARLPRGPTLSFKIHNFCLSRDVVSSLKKQQVIEQAFKHSPLIVLNSFSGEGMHLKMMASMFQNMFPTINLTNVDLNTVRRCVLMNYNPSTKLIDFRHYNIKVAPVGISKGVKKVVQGKVPNLSRCDDIAEFFTKTANMSESEADDDPSNFITVPQKLQTRGNIESGKSAIRLTELGPRLTLQLIKIEDGLLNGEVLYHELVSKTEEEKLAIAKKREQKRRLKERRKKVQEENKQAKEQNKQALKEKSMKGILKKRAESEVMMKKAVEEANNDVQMAEDDDREYYREEVGEEPDKDLFTSSTTGAKRPRTFHSFRNKRQKGDERKGKFNNRKDGQKNRKIDKVSGNRDRRPIGGKFRKK